MLDEAVRSHWKRRYEQLLEQSLLPSREKLQECYSTFRSHFAPEKLLQLAGEELLNTIHAHGNHDSLVYWLEFKDDEEFPAYFGSIAGGSALKFGIYRRKETGAWMTGQPTAQKEISVADAIQIARLHRDQLVAGTRLLEALTADPSDQNYATLQDKMDAAAPDVTDTAWGHKYFALMYPDKLDDFHAAEFQRFHIRKLLQLPPAKEGRYAAAGRYVSAATELEIPLNHLTTTLNRTNGRPYKIWRIGTRLGGKDDIWPMMKEESCAAIGWDDIGDLSGLADDPGGKDKIRKQLEGGGDIPAVASRNANQISTFVTRIDKDDVVLAADGEDVLGIGKVTGPYQYKDSGHHGAPHRRPVQWLDTEKWKLPETEGLQSTVRQVNKFAVNLVEIERRLFGVSPAPAVPPRADPVVQVLLDLEDVPGRIHAALERKGQAVIYGPPGTGKTYWAMSTARRLAAHAAFGSSFEKLDPARQTEVMGSETVEGLVRACTFHPAYGYEDFIEGYRPSTNETGQLSFSLREGIFKRLCRDARKQSDRQFILIIDEINRGDIPRIFGELITLLELDKRESSVQLPVSGTSFSVPKNIYVIGTMNTADRSIALLDTALRRRFGFVEIMPDPTALGTALIEKRIPLGLWLAALNERIRNHIRRDARNLQIGHAYFMESGRPVTDFARFARILAEDIFPLLEEYCYENYGMLRELLGQALVDQENQRLHLELFAPERRDDLISALLANFPEMVTSTAAVVVEQVDPEADAEEELRGERLILNHVSLFEWQTLRPAELGGLKDLVPCFDARSERVIAELAESDRLEILQLRSGVEIRATSWVGRITVGDLAITVRPKIRGTPFLNLLRYAYSLRNLDTYTATSYGATADSFQDLIVEQLANETAELLSRGLHRDYLRFNAALGSPSGRIDFGQMVHATAAAQSAVVCTYYNRSDAVLLNRVLLAGLRLATRASTDNQLCARVSGLAQILEATVPRIVLTQADIDKARQIVDRRTTAYTSAFTLIEILAKGMGIALTEKNDTAQLPGFLFDMNRFFQALISRFLNEELIGFSIRDEYQLKGIFDYDPAHNPQRRRAVVPRPDFLVTSGGQVKEFLDAKYRDLWMGALPPYMLYQLAIYALSKSTGAPRSTILYPTLAADALDQVVLLKDPILGHRRAEVTLRPVSLLAMEKLIRPRRGAVAARQRQQFAWALAFGSSTAAEYT